MFEISGWSLPSKVAPEEKKKKDKGEKAGNEKKSGAVAKKQKQSKDNKRKRERANGQPTGANKKAKSEGSRDKIDKSDESEKSKIEKIQKSDKNEKSGNAQPSKTPDQTQKLTPLQLKMKEKLSGSRFRWINEQLYTIRSEEAVKLIDDNPEMFDEYHNGFRSQVQSWPENPVDSFIAQIKTRLDKPISAPGGMPGEKDGTVVIADMGCGEAQLAADMQNVRGHGKSKKAKFEVHSFDLKKANDRITKADIKDVPLPDESAHIVVFCLALMGTNFLDFIKEGLRILKPRGELWIAEIKSRFVDNDTTQFVNVLKDLGLLHKTTDDSNKMFIRFEFFKPPKDVAQDRERRKQLKKKFIDSEQEDDHKRRTEGQWLLKPCIYKRR